MNFRKGQIVWRVEGETIKSGAVTLIEPCNISSSGGAEPCETGRYSLARAQIDGRYYSQTCDDHEFCSTKDLAFARLERNATRRIDGLIAELAKWSDIRARAHLQQRSLIVPLASPVLLQDRG